MSTDTRSLDELVDAGDVAMLTTSNGRTMSSRPLTVAEAYGGVLTFLVDTRAPWLPDDADRDSLKELSVTVSTCRNVWVAIRGRGAIGSDPDTIARLRCTPAAADFRSDSSDDPDDLDARNLRALQVSVLEGEYWSAPGATVLGRLMSVVGAALGNGDPGPEHGEVGRD
jgi:Pyridoxamine 5'-phosphate oxidase like